MGIIRRSFTEQEIQVLESNPSVLRVSEKNITYSPAFKIDAVRANQAGSTPIEIFSLAGFEMGLIGQETPKKCLQRWRKIHASLGETGLLEERRGKGSSGRPNSSERSAEERLRLAEARIKLLEAENEILKKLEALERQHPNDNRLPSSERFQLINQVVRKHGLRRVTRYLCKLAEVSTSGYYRWCTAEEKRQLREFADERDGVLIKAHYDALQGKVGALVIKMRLERLNGIIMNHKKIRRLMRKFRLIAVIRQANPYRKMAKIHSDQGFHYTHLQVRSMIAESGFKQSMSRKGNCWDNASMETFFGHMKDELEYKECTSLYELRVRVNEYITYYNTERYQWTLKKMTPDEYRSHLIAA